MKTSIFLGVLFALSMCAFGQMLKPDSAASGFYVPDSASHGWFMMGSAIRPSWTSVFPSSTDSQNVIVGNDTVKTKENAYVIMAQFANKKVLDSLWHAIRVLHIEVDCLKRELIRAEGRE